MFIPALIVASALGQIGGGQCHLSATWPTGPLHKAPITMNLSTSRDVDCVLIDVASLSDPSVEFQVFAAENGAGSFLWALPSGIDSGEYAITLNLLPTSSKCETVIMGPNVYEVE